MPENEAIGILSNGLSNPNPSELKKKWQDSVEKTRQRNYAANLTPIISDIVDETRQSEIDQILTKVQKRLRAQPQPFGNSWELKLISIDGLISIQKSVGIDFANEVVKDVKDKNDLIGALKVAFNAEIKQENPNVSIDPADPNSFTMASKDLNFGFLGYSPTQIPIVNTDEKLLGGGLNFGSKLSYIQVLNSNGRYVLSDGFHRAYGLISKGFTHIPCILYNGDIQQLPQQVGLFPPNLALSENPPMVRDFSVIGDDVTIPEVLNIFKVNIQSSQVLF